MTEPTTKPPVFLGEEMVPVEQAAIALRSRLGFVRGWRAHSPELFADVDGRECVAVSRLIEAVRERTSARLSEVEVVTNKRDEHVYLLYCAELGLFKVGVSICPYTRADTILTKSGFLGELQVVHTRPGNKDTEHGVHRCLDAFRAHRNRVGGLAAPSEWYDLPPFAVDDLLRWFHG